MEDGASYCESEVLVAATPFGNVEWQLQGLTTSLTENLETVEQSPYAGFL